MPQEQIAASVPRRGRCLGSLVALGAVLVLAAFGPLVGAPRASGTVAVAHSARVCSSGKLRRIGLTRLTVRHASCRTGRRVVRAAHRHRQSCTASGLRAKRCTLRRFRCTARFHRYRDVQTFSCRRHHARVRFGLQA